MNYYNEIKKELVNNEINRKVKIYTINKSYLNTNYNVISEKVLQKLILEDISSFLKELGSGFTFENEYIIKIGNAYNYIDENLRKINQDKTIGIIICKEDNKYIIKYCSDNKIIAREYEFV